MATSACAQYLQRRRQTWFVNVEVPPSPRGTIGRKRLQRTTGTRDLAKAEAMKWRIVAELKDQIARAKRGETAVTEEALEFRSEWLAARTKEEREDLLLWGIGEKADDIRGEPLSEQRDPRDIVGPRSKRKTAFTPESLACLARLPSRSYSAPVIGCRIVH